MNSKSVQSFESCKRHIEKEEPSYLTLLPLYFTGIFINLLNNQFAFNTFIVTTNLWHLRLLAAN